MNDVFVSVENDLDETFKQNELLKDRLLEASLAEDIKNLVITSCVEIRNKDFHDEIERISKESKEVLNESKTADTVFVMINLKSHRGLVKKNFDKSSILGKPPSDKHLINSQISKSWFIPKIVVQKDFSKPVTAQSLPKNEMDQFLKRIASLESKLASQDIHSCQKEYHELRTSYNVLKVKFDALNRKKWNINVSKSSKPKESVSEKVHTGEFSKPFLRRVYQFITYSLQKDRKFSKNSQSFETFFPQKGFKTRASNAKNQSFATSHSCFTPVKQVWRPKQSHSKSFKYSKSEMLSMQNKNDSVSTIHKKERFSNNAKTNFRNVSSSDNNKWKSSSSTRFKNSHETPSFKNQWKIKSNFKSPLIPRELFSTETPVSSSRWNSTSLH
ncbi:hypothetical protein Tco_0090301 [Tanacetum coccineum]